MASHRPSRTDRRLSQEFDDKASVTLHHRELVNTQIKSKPMRPFQVRPV